MNKKTVLILFCYLSIYIIWGTTYFFISKAVETIPPSWVVFSRFFVGGLVLILIPVLAGKVKKMPTKKEVLSSLFLGFFLLIMGNGVVTIAEQTVDSYITSLIISTIPLVVAILNSVIYKTKLNYKQILGFFIGFSGVALLLYSETPKSPGEITGVLLLFLAISCWGFGTSWSKKLTSHENTFLNSGMQMIFASLIAFTVALFQGFNFSETINQISSFSLLSTLFLTFVGGSAIGAYNFLLKHEPTNRVTSYALVNPLIATLIGVYVGGETKTKYLWFGVILILTGLTIMLYLSKPIKGKTKIPV